jgi:hypothetical protein
MDVGGLLGDEELLVDLAAPGASLIGVRPCGAGHISGDRGTLAAAFVAGRRRAIGRRWQCPRSSRVHHAVSAKIKKAKWSS